MKKKKNKELHESLEFLISDFLPSQVPTHT